MCEIDIQPDAANDIRLIAEYTIEKFGMEQARIYTDEMEEKFQLLAEYPRLGRTTRSSKYPRAHRHGHGVHTVIYSFDDEIVTIHRIFHARSNYTRHL